MVNPTTDSSSPSTLAFTQHSGLINTPATEEDASDDPPPIPGPPASRRGQHVSDSRDVPARGNYNNDNIQVDLTAGDSSQRQDPQAESRVYNQPPAESQISDKVYNQCPDTTDARIYEPADSHFSDRVDKQRPNVGGVRIYDYGADSPTSSGEELQITRIRTNEYSSPTAATSYQDVTSPSSTNSSFTAVDQDAETLIEISGAYNGMNPHTIEADAVAIGLDVNLVNGLSTSDAKERLRMEGPNTLTTDAGITWYGVLLRQISNSLTLVGDPVNLLFLSSFCFEFPNARRGKWHRLLSPLLSYTLAQRMCVRFAFTPIHGEETNPKSQPLPHLPCPSPEQLSCVFFLEEYTHVCAPAVEEICPVLRYLPLFWKRGCLCCVFTVTEREDLKSKLKVPSFSIVETGSVLSLIPNLKLGTPTTRRALVRNETY